MYLETSTVTLIPGFFTADAEDMTDIWKFGEKTLITNCPFHVIRFYIVYLVGELLHVRFRATIGVVKRATCDISMRIIL